jgi:hypothetical protein
MLTLLIPEQDESHAANDHQDAQRAWYGNYTPRLDLYPLSLYHQVLPLRRHHHIRTDQGARA